MITRAQIRRQLRKDGGIMNVVPREQYGLGSFIKKAVGKVGDIAGQVIKSPIGKAAILGLGAYGLGGGFGGIGPKIGGSGIGQFFKGMGPKLFGSAAGSAAGPMSYLQKGVQQFTPGILGKLGITKGGGAMGLTGLGKLAGGAGLLTYFMSKGKTEEEAKGLMQDVKRGEGLGLDIIQADMKNYRSGALSGSQAYDKGYRFLTPRNYMQAATGGRAGFQDGTPEEGIKSLDAGASSIKREGDVYPKDDDITNQMYISDELGALPKKDGGVLPEDMGKLTITDFESKEDYGRYLRILHQGTRESLEENLPSQEDIKRFIPEDVLEERAQGGRIGYSNGSDNRDFYTALQEEEGPGAYHEQEILEEFGSPLIQIVIPGTQKTSKAQGGRIGYRHGSGHKTSGSEPRPDKYKFIQKSRTPLGKKPSGIKKINPEYTEWKNKRIGKYGGGVTSAMPRIPTGMPRVNAGGISELDYRAKGGFVPVGVKEKADDVPAMLSKNEFVMTADAVRAAGGGSVEKGAQKMYNTMKQLEGRIA